MKKELAIIVLASWVGLIWCNQVPERPAYNFGETYRVYGDTKECIEGSSGTKCHWYQTQYFQMLTNRTLRIDTNVKKFYESFFYRPSNNGFFRYHYIPSNWRAPCTVKEVPTMPIQRVPISFTFNGTDTVEWKTCNLWRRDTGYNPVTTETWCIRYNNDVYPSTTEPLSFTVKQTNLTRETLWRGYTTSVAKWYFKLPYECPSPPSPPEDNTDNDNDNNRNENGNPSNTVDNNMRGLTTMEPMETKMATKMTVTTKMQSVTTTASERKVEDKYDNDNNGHGPTMTTTSMMKRKMATVTMAIKDNDEDTYGNDNKGKYTTTPPKRMKTTKMKTATMYIRPTMTSKMAKTTELKTATMEVTELDMTTKMDDYDGHSKEERQTTSATFATKLKTTTLPSMPTMTRNDDEDNDDENEDEDGNNNNNLFNNS